MRLLITGGTGTFGKAFIRKFLSSKLFDQICIYSRDEFKQHQMTQDGSMQHEKLRFFIGDVRDKERLMMAMKGVDVVIHASALKQVPSCEYNPAEAVKTNVLGAINVIECSIENGVSKVVALSTDKAVNPINLYGATKLCADKLFISACAYTKKTKFSVVRYGNVAGSRGSVIPVFNKIHTRGSKLFPITDTRMTRFWITTDEAVDLVVHAIQDMEGGETYIAKIPSFYVTDLAKAFTPDASFKNIGIRPGEKLHEIMITSNDHVYETDKHYIILPSFDWFKYDKYGDEWFTNFSYTSDKNELFMSVDDIRIKISEMNFMESV